jgi:two-component system C4-dicarboxylate transport sensor histidine kinase DctB
MKIQYWFGIKGRLLLVFSVLSAFTLFASTIGWVSHNTLAIELKTVAKSNTQALKLMAKIKEHGVIIMITTPTLLSAKTINEKEKTAKLLRHHVSQITASLPKVRQLLPLQQNHPISNQFSSLLSIFMQLEHNVDLRLAINSEKDEIDRRLRWASAVFLSDIDSLNEYIKNNLYSQIRDNDFNIKSIISNELQVAYHLSADVSLLTNLLDRAQHLDDLNSQIATSIHSEEIVLRIKTNLNILNERVHLEAIQNTVAHIIDLASAKNNIFSLHATERDIKQNGLQLLARTHLELSNLDKLLATLTQQANDTSQQAIDNAQQTIDKGRMLMVTSVIASFLFSIMIVWLYVGRNMVARITSLNKAMRAIANGDLQQQISIKGNDEIGTMARSLKSFRDQLTTLQEELVQTGKLAAVGQLSAGIAHEINQPLAAIRLYSHNGVRFIQANKPEQAQENLNNISHLIKRAISIIDRLNALARNETLSLQTVDIYDVLTRALKDHIRDEVVNVECISNEVQARQFFVCVDAIQLEQVIINLINNALDAIADSDIKQIIISAKTIRDDCYLYINDTGPGIDDDVRNKIFDPFFTTKPRGQNLGLGLSISYNIIKSFNGKLSVQNTPHSGASFNIKLPKATNLTPTSLTRNHHE